MASKKFDVGLRDLNRKLVKMRKVVVAQVMTKGLETIGKKAAARAAGLTPRSKGPGPHVADGWTSVSKRGKGGTIAVEIFNTLDKANEELSIKGGGSTTLLHILELGSAPHEIEPKNAKFLRFTVAGGKVIFTKKVHHPGTRPYSMLTIAGTEAVEGLKRLIDDIRTAIRTGRI